MRYYLFILSLAFLLISCSTNKDNEQHTNAIDIKQPSKSTQIEEEGPVIQLSSFFPSDGSTAYFLGEGNEFASYTIQTTYIDASHVAQLEDNGGVKLLKVYRITDTTIALVYKNIVENSPSLPTIQEAASYPIIETILQQPLEIGSSFDGWTIQSTTATVDTGTTVYEDVIQIKRTQDTITTNKYFALGVGLIRSEDTMVTEGEEPFSVTSTLQKIE